jgi:hypothetical protein
MGCLFYYLATKGAPDWRAKAPASGEAPAAGRGVPGETEKLTTDQGGRLTLEKGDDPGDLRKALKAAAGSLNRRIRFPFRGGRRRGELLPGKGEGAEAERGGGAGPQA